MDTNRRKRIRRLVHRLNQQRRRQAQKIDILCNDMVAAHKDFVIQLNSLMFTTNFYESILGHSDLRELLETVAQWIQQRISGAHVAVFLLTGESIEMHCVDNDNPIGLDANGIEHCFTPEVIRNISRANWICSLGDMIRLGLRCDCRPMDRVSAAAVPLGRYQPGVGFLLIYRSSDTPLLPGELRSLAGITPGLSRAIQACRKFTQTPQPG
ncbi:MAG: hypothetical protein JXA82_15370 [Sedimentisphaerales bacterium]|nr:hypothetical protein [Sedimentisphaerales bacterium]